VDRLFGRPQERRHRGWFGVQEQRAEARAMARANILRPAEDERVPSPLSGPATIVWRWHAGRWERWSEVWEAYEVDEVPETLPDQLAAEGRAPAEGERFRFDGERWHPLGPDDDERARPDPDAEPTPAEPHVAPPGDQEATGDAPPGAPGPADPSRPPEEPERPSTEEMLEAWRRRNRG
jgi:hypothetical protein